MYSLYYVFKVIYGMCWIGYINCQTLMDAHPAGCIRPPNMLYPAPNVLYPALAAG